MPRHLPRVRKHERNHHLIFFCYPDHLGSTSHVTDADDKSYGINIHHAGVGNLTGMTSKGTGISEGCLLIDITHWDDFISLFNTPEQKGNIVGVSVSRSMSRPSNSHWEPLPMPSIPICVPDALNIINPRIR